MKKQLKISTEIRNELLGMLDEIDVYKVEMAALGANYDNVLLKELKRIGAKGLLRQFTCLDCRGVRHNSILNCPCEAK